MKQIMIHLDRCNGCMTCTLACAAAHSLTGTITGAMSEGVPSRIQVLPAVSRPVPMMCRHCEEPACVDACMAGAMVKDPKTGIVTNEGNEQVCVGCWMCIMVCPYGAVTQHPDKKVAIKCDRCISRPVPACVESCPNGALEFVEVDNYASARQKATARSLAAATREV